MKPAAPPAGPDSWKSLVVPVFSWQPATVADPPGPPRAEPYQDVWVRGRVRQRGARECAERFEIVRRFCSRFRRPFTVLDLGANLGYFSLRLAETFDCTTVAVEGEHGGWLEEILRANGNPRVILLRKTCSPEDLRALAEVEHFDVVLALSFIHHLEGGFQESLDTLRALGEHLILELPFDAGNGAEHLSREVRLPAGARRLGQGQSHRPGARRDIVLLPTPKPRLGRPFLGARRTAPEPTIHSTWDEKRAHASRRQASRDWHPGLNLRTYLWLGGAWPLKADIAAQIRAKAAALSLPAEPQPHDVILSGKEVHFIGRAGARPEPPSRAVDLEADTVLVTRADVAAEATPISASASHATSPIAVSVIMPWPDGVERAARFLERLRNAVNAAPAFEVLFLDERGDPDGHDPATALESRFPFARVLRCAESRGRDASTFFAARMARGTHLVLAAVDLEPEPGWLQHALSRFEREPDTGVVGSKLLYPDRSVQHAGVEFVRGVQPGFPIWPLHRYWQFPEDDPGVNQPAGLCGVSGAGLFVERALFLEAGGLSGDLAPPFDVLDLCFKARERGRRVWYEPRSVAVVRADRSQQPNGRPGPETLRAAARFFRAWPEALARLELETYVIRQEGKCRFLSHDLLPALADARPGGRRLRAAAARLLRLLPALEPFHTHFGGVQDALDMLTDDLASPPRVVLSQADSTDDARRLFEVVRDVEQVWFLPPGPTPRLQQMLRVVLRRLPNCLGVHGEAVTRSEVTEKPASSDVSEEAATRAPGGGLPGAGRRLAREAVPERESVSNLAEPA